MKLTIKKALELVEAYVAVPSTSLVLHFLNQGAREFCMKSGAARMTTTTNSVAGKRYYALPDSIGRISKVTFNDVTIPRFIGDVGIDDDELAATDANALPTPNSSSNKRYWYLDDSRLGIIEKGVVSRDGVISNVQSCSISGTKNIRIYASSKGTALTTSMDVDSDSQGWLGEIAAEYHHAPIYKAVSDIYALPATINTDLHDNFANKFKSMIVDAKKESKMRYQTTGFIKPCDF